MFDKHFPENHRELMAACPLTSRVYPGLDIRVIASQIPPRDQRWQYFLDSSKRIAEALFDGGYNRCLQTEHLVVYFPERWLTPVEEGKFMAALVENQIINAIKPRIDILTCSSVILTDCTATMVRVIMEEQS
jgi:hypothetical protein